MDPSGEPGANFRYVYAWRPWGRLDPAVILPGETRWPPIIGFAGALIVSLLMWWGIIEMMIWAFRTATQPG